MWDIVLYKENFIVAKLIHLSDRGAFIVTVSVDVVSKHTHLIIATAYVLILFCLPLLGRKGFKT